MKSLFLTAPLCAVVAIAPLPAAAQDIQPVFDLPTMAQGQVISSTAKNQGRHASRSDLTAHRAKICAQRPRLRRQYGTDNPKLQELERRCERDGF